MIVLGIDPGTRRIGYGIVEKGAPPGFRDAGILPIEGANDREALKEAKQRLDALIKKWKPGLISVEKLYFSKNRRTAMRVAEARGAILLAAAESGVPTVEYGPNEVKMGVAGYGLADKKAVAKMVGIILERRDLRLLDDAWDALALAILACQSFPLDNKGASPILPSRD